MDGLDLCGGLTRFCVVGRTPVESVAATLLFINSFLKHTNKQTKSVFKLRRSAVGIGTNSWMGEKRREEKLERRRYGDMEIWREEKVGKVKL